MTCNYSKSIYPFNIIYLLLPYLRNSLHSEGKVVVIVLVPYTGILLIIPVIWAIMRIFAVLNHSIKEDADLIISVNLVFSC